MAQMINETINVTYESIICGGCGIKYFVPEYWLEKRRANNGSFNCPNGCSRVFVGETEAEKVRKELKRKEQELSEMVIEKTQLQLKLNKTEKEFTRLKKGVCPCCNRTFSNLNNHIKYQHPELLNLTPKKYPIKKKTA